MSAAGWIFLARSRGCSRASDLLAIRTRGSRLRARSRSLMRPFGSLIEYPWTFPRAKRLYRGLATNRRPFITMDDAVSMAGIRCETAGDRYFLPHALCLPSVYIRISRVGHGGIHLCAPDDFRLTDIFRDVSPRRYSPIADIYGAISARCYLNPANANARDHIAIIIIIKINAH